jgi:hypothetical protein
MEYMTCKKYQHRWSKTRNLVSTIVMDAETDVPREPLSMLEKIRDGFLPITRRGSNLWGADVIVGIIQKRVYW